MTETAASRPAVAIGLGRTAVLESVARVDDLIERTGGPATALWASVGPWDEAEPGWTPVVIEVGRDGELVAAARLAMRVRRGLVSVAVLGRPEEPAWFPALDAGAARMLAGAVVDHLGTTVARWRLRLTQLPERDPFLVELGRLLPRHHFSGAGPTVQLRFRDGAPVSDYLSSNTRKAVAKATNRMRGEGLRPETEWLRTPAEVAGRMDEILRVHKERNRQVRGLAVLDDPAEEALFVGTVLGHAREGRCRLLTLRLDGELAAFAIGLVSGGSMYVYANLVSPRWTRYSAGRVANAEVVRAAHADRELRGVDWGPGPQRYKLSGDATELPLVTVDGWSSPAVRVALAAVSRTRRGVRMVARPGGRLGGRPGPRAAGDGAFRAGARGV